MQICDYLHRDILSSWNEIPRSLGACGIVDRYGSQVSYESSTTKSIKYQSCRPAVVLVEAIHFPVASYVRSRAVRLINPSSIVLVLQRKL